MPKIVGLVEKKADAPGFTSFFFLSLCVSVSVSVCLSVSVWVSVCVYVSVCLCLSMCLSVSVCLSLFVSLSLFLFVFLSLSLSVSVSLSLTLALSLSSSLSRSVYLTLFLSLSLVPPYPQFPQIERQLRLPGRGLLWSRQCSFSTLSQLFCTVKASKESFVSRLSRYASQSQHTLCAGMVRFNRFSALVPHPELMQQALLFTVSLESV